MRPPDPVVNRPALPVALPVAVAVLLLTAPVGLGLPGPVDGGPRPASAQEPAGRDSALGPDVSLGRPGGALADSVQLVDRVLAVVSDTAILLTDLQQEIYRMRQQGVEIPQDPARRDSLMFRTLQDMVDRTLLLERAKQEGVQVSEDAVQSEADTRFEQIRSNFPSDQALRDAVEASGQNMFQYRQMLQARVRQEMMLANFQQELMTSNRLPPASVSEEEIRSYFQQNAARANRPATVSFRRVLVAPEPSAQAADSARQLARQALEEIRSGTSFAVVARRYSDDTGTREEGGDLGWIRRSDVAPSFGDAAWRAPPGEAVGPVETRFGYHLIKVTNTRGGERQIRHILIRPRVDDAQVEAARRLAGALADSLRSGVDADRLAREHGLPDRQVVFEQVQLDRLGQRLGEAYREALGTPREGEVVGPIRQEGAFGLANFAVLQVTGYRPAGTYDLEDVRNQIRQRLLRQKQMERYTERLRGRMYVDLRI